MVLELEVLGRGSCGVGEGEIWCWGRGVGDCGELWIWGGVLLLVVVRGCGTSGISSGLLGRFAFHKRCLENGPYHGT